jgi:phosphoribosylformylglycinamidine (FGAM) synthase-like amidotransferase family enzyme
MRFFLFNVSVYCLPNQARLFFLSSNSSNCLKTILNGFVQEGANGILVPGGFSEGDSRVLYFVGIIFVIFFY